MNKNNRGCRKLECAAYDFAGVNRSVINRTNPLNLVRNQPVPFVEKQDPELLAGFMRHRRRAVIYYR